MGPRCKDGLSRFFGHLVLVLLGSNLAFAVVSMALCLGVAAPFSSQPAALVASYERQIAVIAQLFLAALVAYFFWSFILARLGDIIGPPLGAAVAAAVVPAAQYVTTGKVSLDAKGIAAAALGAAAGVFGMRLGEIRRNPPPAP
jgi:hypothetical protein